MTPLLRASIAVLGLFAASCRLLATDDTENVPGRGPQAFDPYTAASPARRLSLQWLNGCSILATGSPVAKGTTVNVPYPTECPDVNQGLGMGEPGAVMQILADTPYFLNRITLVDTIIDDPDQSNSLNLAAPLAWAKSASVFKDLDWSGVGMDLDEFTPGTNPPNGTRTIVYDNAAWMLDRTDSLLVEILDAAGTVKASQTYTREEFMADGVANGHTRVTFLIDNMAPPKFAGDLGINNEVFDPPTYRTMAKVEFEGSMNPFKTITASGVSGDGAIRITWSQLPAKPFIFPVTFVDKTTLPKTCFNTADESEVACDFGLTPTIQLSTPANGSFYTQGETFDLFLDIRDGRGNRLHPKPYLYSYNSYADGSNNGLLYLNQALQLTIQDHDFIGGYKVVGPIQNLVTQSSVADDPSFVSLPPLLPAGGSSIAAFPPEYAGTIFAGSRSGLWGTRQPIHLPADAKPGTYAAVVKMHREYLGERVSASRVQLFQVGQAELTNYPSRVGNCQICHRGVASLDNVRHGLSVDHIETCKACHVNSLYPLARDIHRVHMMSKKYNQPNNDCTVCHLTREGAVRPSYDVCSSCHPATHGTEYFPVKISTIDQPTRYGTCASSCHALHTPQNHILPKE